MAAPAPPFPWKALTRLYRVMGSIALPWALARMYPAAEAAPVARKRPGLVRFTARKIVEAVQLFSFLFNSYF